MRKTRGQGSRDRQSRVPRWLGRVAGFVAAGLIASSPVGCSRLRGEPRPEPTHSETEEHGHADQEESDLDRPVAELFEARCEHSLRTYECDECRYEVGVVKAPAHLFDGGLLQTTGVERRSVETPLRLTGEVEFDQRRVAHVSTQAEGMIRKVHVTLGDTVDAGDALLEVDSVAAGDAQAAYLESRAELKLAERNYDRLAELRKEGISSEKSLFQAEQERNAAKIRVEAASRKLGRLGVASAAGSLVLRAPAAGTVLDMHAVAGEVAKAGEPLVTVGDNASVWVWADLYERDIALVTRAQREAPLAAEIEVKAYPKRRFPGTVDFVSPTMSESSRTVKLRIAVPNEGRQLLAGMFATVQLFLPGEGQALALPHEAVVEDEGRSFVFVHHHDDYYVRRPVAVGRGSGGFVVITRGLTGDETVVADGSFLLKSDVLRSKMGAGCAD